MDIDYEAFMVRLATGTPVTLSQWNGIGVILRRESPAYTATENSYRSNLRPPATRTEPAKRN
jgi:hypothetical protein